MPAPNKAPVLAVFGGLPGTGKTTLARALSSHLRAVYLRIDTAEQALRDADAMRVGHEGYAVSYALAAENLRLGNTVVADSVNPLPVTREAWRDVAKSSNARLVEIEVTCSDKAEHRRRVESRIADIRGHKMPTWQEVAEREYHDWQGRHILVDTSKNSEADCLKMLIERVSAA